MVASEELSKETQNDLIEFQNLQQQLQILALQKQQVAAQVAEIDKASEEIDKAGETGSGAGAGFYRFVGSVIVPKKKEDLRKELNGEKESLELRKSVFEKQETKLRERFVSLRKKLEAALGGGSGGSGVGGKGGKAGSGEGALVSS